MLHIAAVERETGIAKDTLRLGKTLWFSAAFA
jgi:hypothetical protein